MKHVEVQIIGDGKGNYVHLGEKEIARFNVKPKLIEECPCAALTEERRQQICADASCSR